MAPLALVSLAGWSIGLSLWGPARREGAGVKSTGIQTRLRMLAVLVAILPLLGLLGTVTGMINTFGIIRSEGLGDPRLLAGGIREALVATECGLATALPLLVFHQILSTRVRHAEIDHDLKEAGHD